MRRPPAHPLDDWQKEESVRDHTVLVALLSWLVIFALVWAMTEYWRDWSAALEGWLR